MTTLATTIRLSQIPLGATLAKKKQQRKLLTTSETVKKATATPDTRSTETI